MSTPPVVGNDSGTASSAIDTARPVDDRLRVLTLNLWNRQGPWERRLALIREGIARLAPDVIGLQEVLRHDSHSDDLATDVARGLGYDHIAFGPAWHIGGGLRFGNAVLSRHPIVEKRAWPLPGIEGEETRALLHVEVATPFGALPFFVTHLAWRLHQGALRQQQVAFIAARVSELAIERPHTLPSVLVGDFNAEPDSDEMRYLRGHHALEGKTIAWYDCWRFCQDGPGHTFARRNPFALRAHEPNRRIDYVYVRMLDRQLRGEPLVCRVVLDEPDDDGVFPSDHFGVYAELAATPRALE